MEEKEEERVKDDEICLNKIGWKGNKDRRVLNEMKET